MDPLTVHWILTLHAAFTLYMTGVIWFVQWVHYPLFREVSPAQFEHYQKEHMRRTAWVVAIPMLLEFGCSILIAFTLQTALAWTGFLLVALIWVITASFQVPAHRRLSHGFDAATHRRLVLTNWARTALWTARSVIALALLRTAA
jgi:hypothetical protein